VLEGSRRACLWEPAAGLGQGAVWGWAAEAPDCGCRSAAGLDTCLSIMRVLSLQTGDPKYRPCPLLVRPRRPHPPHSTGQGSPLRRVPGLRSTAARAAMPGLLAATRQACRP